MAFLHALGIGGSLAFILWGVVRRALARRAVTLVEIPGPSKEHWLKGNYHRILQDGLRYNLHLIDKYGGAFKIYALLGSEQLYISDPLALQHIVIKEQHVYEETDMFIMGNQLIFGEGLISTLGEQHRKQRKMLNPVFSIANMRELHPVVQPIADQLCRIILSEVTPDESKEIDVLPWVSRGALEYVCQAALGHSFNALDPNNRSEYLHAIRMLAPTTLRLLFLRPFIPFFVCNFSSYWRNKMVSWAPMPALKDICRMVQIMDSTSREIFCKRKATLQKGRNDKTVDSHSLGARMGGMDIMSTMLKANVSPSHPDYLSDAELIGQMNTFIFAGLETVTSSICRILCIIASKPSVQARLRAEIRSAKCELKYGAGDPAEYNLTEWEDVVLPYDVLHGLPYLDAVVKETLRIHPPTSLLSRTARQDAVLPLYRSVRSRSGEMLNKIVIPKGTTLIMSILGANLNKEVWGEDAREWKAERWLGARDNICGDGDVGDGSGGELSEAELSDGELAGVRGGIRYPGVYASMMTFLGGGRACIGFKFAEMEIKQVITSLLSRLHFSLPSVPDESGNVKEIYWKMNSLQVPVVLPPAGDGVTAQVPLGVRKVRAEDFSIEV